MIERTHVVDVYRPSSTRTAGGQQEPDYGVPVLADVDCNLQALTGGVRAMERGRDVEHKWKGFFPPGTVLKEGDGIHVKTGTGPAYREVVWVGEVTGEWDTPVELTDAQSAWETV